MLQRLNLSDQAMLRTKVSVIDPGINASHVTTEIHESSYHDTITGPEFKPVPASGLRVNLNMIVSKHPAIKGIDFDQPHVIQHPLIYPVTVLKSGFTYNGETRAT
nr:O-methyltransferase COMT-type, S-adenosyl-L-methionine-dependent methyltransferase [Tanacetum cinerariifolium]